MNVYINLFLAFLQIGAFSFGGGYAAIPLIQSQIIDKYGWLSEADFSDLITISQMTPGPIAVNAATFVGDKVAGPIGAAVATLGVILPSCIIITVLAFLYTKYRELPMLKKILTLLRPAVIAMIISAGLAILMPTIFKSGEADFFNGNFMIVPFMLFIAGVFVLAKFKLNPITVMLSCCILAILISAITGQSFI